MRNSSPLPKRENKMAKIKAVLYSESRPSDAQFARFVRFLTEKYGDTELEWVRSSAYPGGFGLEVGGDVYDWSAGGRLAQLKNKLASLALSESNVIPLIRKAVDEWSPEVLSEERGRVLSVGDGIARVDGLAHATYGEIVIFECGVKGMVQELRRDSAGVIMFGDSRDVAAGSAVHRTGKTAGVPVGDGFLGRVINALGEPVDDEGAIEADGYRPIECPAPGIVDRQPVNKPMETGLLVVDALFPIGRGQRELIIGDRQTGKTAIALDTIINQKGKDVLIVYDDLSKHAVAYRTLSLLLERAPGREAYPGDVFYLHSRLLERAAHLSDELGGGSMTALPVVETQAGDVSAYIPTNVISITDGQIFLESELFFEGQRPAVNVGLSVSRVGGNAQTQAVKKAVGSLRLDLAQYREMEVFMQFAGDLDELTRKQLFYGQGLMRLLRQPQCKPYTQAQEVLLLVCALGHVFESVPPARINAEAERLIAALEERHPEFSVEIADTGKLSPELKENILKAANAVMAEMK